MFRRITAVVMALMLTVASGCFPTTFVRKDPGVHDRGIRYYRPKPYLLLKPLVTVDEDKQLIPDLAEISIEYLPDYSEEYSIHMRSWFGTNNTNITLENGWNLTGLNVNIDSKTAENIDAITNLLGGIVSAAKSGEQVNKMPVRCTNVPMGLYEAVISPDNCGVKRLFGFRYVGFFPFAECPMEACGLQKQLCADGEIYGLVWESNAMVFRRLDEVRCHVNLEPAGQCLVSDEDFTPFATSSREANEDGDSHQIQDGYGHADAIRFSR